MGEVPMPADDEPSDVRGLLTRFLRGSGVELGPGHHPLALRFPGASVRYVDRWEPNENRELFPELVEARFPRPDLVANLDTDGLTALADASQDFVIASHLLEHLADPLEQLSEMHRVLRPGGVALIFLPDRRFTLDSKREPTALEHLIADHDARVTVVSDAHIEEFLRGTDVWQEEWNDDKPLDLFERHRNRSIHVHCWTQDEFLTVVEHTITAMGMDWELLDAAFTEETGFEFGLVLRRSMVNTAPDIVVAHLRATWGTLSNRAHQPRGGPLYASARRLWWHLRRTFMGG